MLSGRIGLFRSLPTSWIVHIYIDIYNANSCVTWEGSQISEKRQRMSRRKKKKKPLPKRRDDENTFPVLIVRGRSSIPLGGRIPSTWLLFRSRRIGFKCYQLNQDSCVIERPLRGCAFCSTVRCPCDEPHGLLATVPRAEEFRVFTPACMGKSSGSSTHARDVMTRGANGYLASCSSRVLSSPPLACIRHRSC